MSCSLDLKNLHTDNRNEFVLFATHNFLLYREKNKLVLASCDGTRLSEIVLPVGSDEYECLDLGDSIFFMFRGQEIVTVDKNGFEPIKHSVSPTKVGIGITECFQASENCIIIGTKQADRVQFINYNFMEQQREAQTSFWKVKEVTDIIHDKNTNIIYAVLDSSIIVACDMKTGETLWTRFETALVNRGMSVHEGNLFYSCQGLLKKTDGQKTESIRLPLISACSIEHGSGQSLYITNECKSLCRYDINSRILVWEIHGQQEIKNSLAARSQDGSEILLLQTKEYIGIVNLTSGTSESFIRTPNILKMRITGDHLLIQKTNNMTILVPGI